LQPEKAGSTKLYKVKFARSFHPYREIIAGGTAARKPPPAPNQEISQETFDKAEIAVLRRVGNQRQADGSAECGEKTIRITIATRQVGI